VRERFQGVTPAIAATALLLLIIVCVAPWGEFPINDDWHFAHIAKNFAERGVLAIDLQSSSSVVGQSVLVWPVIHFLGFSFLKLRLLTMVVSVLIIFELDYLLRLAAVSRGVRVFTLCLLVVNPFFLYFSTSFMLEHYSVFVALLAACIWYKGRCDENTQLLLVAAATAGFAFWIRQLSALVLPAILLAELVASGLPAFRRRLASRAAAFGIWIAVVGSFFIWARATGSQTEQASSALERVTKPDPLILFFQFGIFVFYVTFFVAPFIIAWLRRENPRFKALLIPSLLILSAGFAIYFGVSAGVPRGNIHRSFPFLHNVFTQYGVGPILLTDVYIEESGVRPIEPPFIWVFAELLLIAIAVGWARLLGAIREAKNEIALFGMCFALLNFVAVGLSFITAIFDRYHYYGIVGFTIAAATVVPVAAMRRFYRAASVSVVVLGLFSTLGLHDYFRWNDARAELAREAEQRGIKRSELDGGYETNGWNDIEKLGVSADCGYKQFWFCGTRPYRIGLTKYPSDEVLSTRQVRAWLLPFPPVLLLKRGVIKSEKL
jgi:hypothetical protein